MLPPLLRGTFCIWGHLALEQGTCPGPEAGDGGVGTKSPFARSGPVRLLQLMLRGLGALGGLSAPFTPEAPAPGTMPSTGWAHSPRLLMCKPCQPTYPVPGPSQPLENQAWELPPSPSRKRSGGPFMDKSQAVDHGPECARLPCPDCASHCPVSASWPVSKAPVATGTEDSGWPFRRSGSSSRGGSCLVSCFPK